MIPSKILRKFSLYLLLTFSIVAARYATCNGMLYSKNISDWLYLHISIDWERYNIWVRGKVDIYSFYRIFLPSVARNSILLLVFAMACSSASDASRLPLPLCWSARVE